MMWVIAAILITVPSVTSECGEELSLTASNPTITFTTPNYPSLHKPQEICRWKVSAPGNVAELNLLCNLDIYRSPKCSYAVFSFRYYDKIQTICGTGRIQETLKGSTGIFTLESYLRKNPKYKGVSCTVSYNPEDIPTGTTLVNPSCKCGQKRGQRIVGGKETKPNEYPWQALLIKKLTRFAFCGGTVIAKDWVLSASHCVEGEKPYELLVVLGEHNNANSDSLSQDFNVTKIIMHEHYGFITKNDNDIALLKLAKSVVFNQAISPICLPFNYKYNDFTNKTGITSGWGLTTPGDDNSGSTVLKEIDEKMIMPSKCTSLDGYGWGPTQITENMICALAQNGGTCQGDSGGPMAWKSDSSNLYFQLGVTSFGGECASPTDPNVYARVSKFVEWIVANTGARDEFCVKI